METTTVKFISSSEIIDAIAEEICKQDSDADHLELTEEITNSVSDDGEYTFGTNYASLVELVPFVDFCFRVADKTATIHNPTTVALAFWSRPDIKKFLRSKVKTFVDLET